MVGGDGVNGNCVTLGEGGVGKNGGGGDTFCVGMYEKASTGIVGGGRFNGAGLGGAVDDIATGCCKKITGTGAGCVVGDKAIIRSGK